MRKMIGRGQAELRAPSSKVQTIEGQMLASHRIRDDKAARGFADDKWFSVQERMLTGLTLGESAEVSA